MRHFIDPENQELFSYDDDAPDYFIKPGLEPITDEEYSEIIRNRESPNLDYEHLSSEAKAKRDQILFVAGIRIAPLQDAVDLGRASQDAVRLLEKWKLYRIDVSDIVLQEGFPEVISWPYEPE